MKLLIALIALATACAGPEPSIAPHPAIGSVCLLLDGVETPFQDPQVLSIDDANQVFQISLLSIGLPESPTPLSPALTSGTKQLVGTSWGRSGDVSDFTFRATPAEAREFATALGVLVHEREPWRGELTGRLEAAGKLHAGAEHLPLRFTLTNTGPVALWCFDGGRSRNQLGRDNRFTFEIERDGERVPTRELPDFGGFGDYHRLAPGESRALEPDLAHWCRLERPGKYVVRAAYEADLMPAEYEPEKVLLPGWYTHLTRARNVRAELAITLR